MKKIILGPNYPFNNVFTKKTNLNNFLKGMTILDWNAVLVEGM